MKTDHADQIRRSFTLQADQFHDRSMTKEKTQHLEHTVQAIQLAPTDRVLDVASGTVLLALAMAPEVASVTCVDATPAMLHQAKEAATRLAMSNLSFVEADAKSLPFDDQTFDVVSARLCFHHFPEVQTPFAEMDRVLKAGGRLVIIDMAGAPEGSRANADEIETLRDPSHVKKLSREEFLALYRSLGYEMVCQESARFPITLQSWLELTQTPDAIREKITGRMEDDLAGGAKTGFGPYRKGGELTFDQIWLLFIGIKP